MKLSQKNKIIISISLFLVIFAALIVVGTFFDLELNHLVAKNALAPGEYFADDFFGVFGEFVGAFPVFALIGVCGIILCLAVARKITNKGVKYLLCSVFFVVSVVGFWYAFHETLKYVLEHVGAEDFRYNPAFVASKVVFALGLSVTTYLAMKPMSNESIFKLVKFVFASVFALAFANLLVMVIKVPMGRIRYRAMNYDGDFSAFMPWYEVGGQPSDSVIAGYPADDAFKSFPSGHTCGAGMSYALLLLPSLFNMSKGKKALCWIVPIVWTGFVGFSRMLVGAHFLTDVTFGGTFAFVGMMIGREIFITKGANIKALFGKTSEEKTE